MEQVRAVKGWWTLGTWLDSHGGSEESVNARLELAEKLFWKEPQLYNGTISTAGRLAAWREGPQSSAVLVQKRGIYLSLCCFAFVDGSMLG